jgi:hypothetical protein
MRDDAKVNIAGVYTYCADQHSRNQSMQHLLSPSCRNITLHLYDEANRQIKPSLIL